MRLKTGNVTLPNGAIICAIDFQASTVLANWHDLYVTWVFDSNLSCYWGHYFGKDLIAAKRDFIERCGGNRND